MSNNTCVMIKSLYNLLNQCEQLMKIEEEIHKETLEDFRSGVAWGKYLAYQNVADTLEAILNKENEDE